MEASGQLHTPVTLPPGKSPQFPMDRRLSGPCSWCECGGGMNPFPTLARNWTPTIQAVALSLYWMGYHGSYDSELNSPNSIYNGIALQNYTSLLQGDGYTAVIYADEIWNITASHIRCTSFLIKSDVIYDSAMQAAFSDRPVQQHPWESLTIF